MVKLKVQHVGERYAYVATVRLCFADGQVRCTVLSMVRSRLFFQEKTMRILMWALIVGTVSLSLLIGCYPSPTAPDTVQAQIQNWPVDSHAPIGLCDENKVCCYSMYSSQSISCVATQVKIVITYAPKIPTELHYQCGDYDNHGEPEWHDCGPAVELPDIPSGETQDERNNQSFQTTGGEVRSRALEARLLRNYRFDGH